MPLHENLIFSSEISDAQYILLHNDIILSIVVSTLNKPCVLLSYFASVNALPSTLKVGCNSLLSLSYIDSNYFAFSEDSIEKLIRPHIREEYEKDK